MSDLKQKTVKGIAFLGAGKSFGRIISFVNTLVLARILSPEDYGLMAMAMVVSGFVAFFNEIGLGSAIVQRKQVSQVQLVGCFYIAMVISVLLYFATYWAAPLANDLYDNDKVGALLQVIALGFILGAVKTVPEALLRREMKFMHISAIEFVSILIHCGTTLALALMGWETWSLVYGMLAGELFRTIAMFAASRWLPTNGGKLSEAIDLMKFGATVTYSRITWYIYSNAQTLILGKVSGDRATGVFTMAQTLAFLPSQHITTLVIQVASPLFARLQEDTKSLNAAILKLTSGLALIAFPVLMGMVLTADELVSVLLGPDWSEVTLPLQLLCVMSACKSIDPLLTQALISIGRADITARYTTLCAVMIPLGVYIGAVNWDIVGASAALAITYPVLMVVLLLITRRYYALSMRQYAQHLAAPVSACLAMAVAIMGIEFALNTWLNVNDFIMLCVKVAVGVLSYCLWLIYTQPKSMQLLHSVLTDLGISEQKLERWPFNQANVR
ncbi:lipopolysaccharide biosynthesis protein [Echinimonas agarilytica]|uniref:Lipopolysaccharide biosynthesis protein n=1 Tax=Echinimonas agarilytica TaxID=1215918 RepID=A0AA42B9L9_9GAMM|nr:lipopolysaccharide biosynthesis protein [Echinimonas agarilytica]MCM2681503.1 lipopolysaccharide biosynthesis protein [Echinimonas agarilytica]